MVSLRLGVLVVSTTRSSVEIRESSEEVKKRGMGSRESHPHERSINCRLHATRDHIRY